MSGAVAQQGTKEYRDDIIASLKSRLPNAINQIIFKIESALVNRELSYIVINQKVDDLSNFVVKKFPINDL